MPLNSSRADRRIPEALSSVRFSRIRQALKGWPFPFLAPADITISPDVRFAPEAVIQRNAGDEVDQSASHAVLKSYYGPA